MERGRGLSESYTNDKRERWKSPFRCHVLCQRFLKLKRSIERYFGTLGRAQLREWELELQVDAKPEGIDGVDSAERWDNVEYFVTR